MTETPHPHGYIHRKDDYLRRLRRIEGQARGLQRMVEDEKYCIDILTQISAITKALQSVGLGLLEEHVSHCLVDAAAAGGRESEEKLKEATDAIARLGAFLTRKVAAVRPRPRRREHPPPTGAHVGWSWLVKPLRTWLESQNGWFVRLPAPAESTIRWPARSYSSPSGSWSRKVPLICKGPLRTAFTVVGRTAGRGAESVIETWASLRLMRVPCDGQSCGRHSRSRGYHTGGG